MLFAVDGGLIVPYTIEPNKDMADVIASPEGEQRSPAIELVKLAQNRMRENGDLKLAISLLNDASSN